MLKPQNTKNPLISPIEYQNQYQKYNMNKRIM